MCRWSAVWHITTLQKLLRRTCWQSCVDSFLRCPRGAKGINCCRFNDPQCWHEVGVWVFRETKQFILFHLIDLPVTPKSEAFTHKKKDVSSSWICVFILGSTFSLKIAGSFPHYRICLQKALRHKLSECNTQYRKTCFCLGLWSGQTLDTQSLLAFCARFRICFDCLDPSLLKSEMLFYCSLTSSPSGYSMGGWGQVDIMDYTADFFGWHFSICRPWVCLLWNMNRIVEQTFLHSVFRSRGNWMKWWNSGDYLIHLVVKKICQLNLTKAVTSLITY